ncbi:MAG: hypothetical protein C9356_12195 [Oleiphilus sp.]|nr:MAG: hypothetical protein C9356_12195 [Oleiphilus sp.]
MNSFIRLIVVCVFAIFFTACAVDPATYQGARKGKPERAPIVNPDVGVRVSYLGKGLIESDDRVEILEHIIGQPIEELENKPWISKRAASAGLATDIAVGQHKSQLGSTVRSAVIGASVLVDIFDSDSYENVSQAFLPEVFNGELLDTYEKANAALRSTVDKKIKGIGSDLGWTVRRIENTIEDVLHYEMIPSIHSGYAYIPESIILMVGIGPARPITLSEEENVLLGFTPKWATPLGNTFNLSLLFAPRFPDREHSHRVNEEGNLMVSNYGSGEVTRLGRNIMRLFYDSPYFVKGSQSVGNRYIVHNGNLYSPSRSVRDGSFVHYLYDEDNSLVP